MLKSTVLAGSSLLSQNNGGSSGRSSASGAGGFNSNKPESVVFCKNYQRGTCQQSRDHFGPFYGENRLLKHICANCWLKDKKFAAHPDTADECPYKG